MKDYKVKYTETLYGFVERVVFVKAQNKNSIKQEIILGNYDCVDSDYTYEDITEDELNGNLYKKCLERILAVTTCDATTKLIEFTLENIKSVEDDIEIQTIEILNK
jgi:hypothetical protein